LREETPSKDVSVDGKVILERILEKFGGKMRTGFIEQWRVLVNRVMNLGFHKRRGDC